MQRKFLAVVTGLLTIGLLFGALPAGASPVDALLVMPEATDAALATERTYLLQSTDQKAGAQGITCEQTVEIYKTVDERSLIVATVHEQDHLAAVGECISLDETIPYHLYQQVSFNYYNRATRAYEEIPGTAKTCRTPSAAGLAVGECDRSKIYDPDRDSDYLDTAHIACVTQWTDHPDDLGPLTRCSTPVLAFKAVATADIPPSS